MADNIETLVREALHELTNTTPLSNPMRPRDKAIDANTDKWLRPWRDLKVVVLAVGAVALLAALITIGVQHGPPPPSRTAATKPPTTTPNAPRVTLKSVIGQTQAVAASTLGAEGLNVGQVLIAASIQYPAGVVIAEDPVAGSVVDRGSSVALTVSNGSTTTSVPQAGNILVPNLIGLTTDQAVGALQAVGLTNSIDNVNCNGSVGKGTVQGQSPAAGFHAAPDNRINLQIVCKVGRTPAHS